MQKRSTKLIDYTRTKSYEDRLKYLNLMKLKNRRLRGDLIQKYKILKGFEKISLTNGINFACSVKNLRRSHDNRLVQEINRRGFIRYNFLTNRCVKLWNSLSVNAVSAQTINIFKAVIGNEVFGMVNSKICQSLSLCG